MKKIHPPAARGDDFAPAYNKLRPQPAKTKRVPQLVKKIPNTTPAKAVQASNYVREAGALQKQLPKAPAKKLPIKKRQYTPSNPGYSKFA